MKKLILWTFIFAFSVAAVSTLSACAGSYKGYEGRNPSGASRL